MNPLISTPVNTTAALLVTSMTLLLWRWAIMGWRHLAGTAHAGTTRSRNIAVTVGILGCSTASLLTLWMPNIIVAIVAGAAAIAFAILEPSRETFWHHDRIRFIGITYYMLLAGVSPWLPFSSFVPLLATLHIFHSHQRQSRRLVSQLLDDIDQLGRRNLKLSSQFRNQQIVRESRGDILGKAG